MKKILLILSFLWISNHSFSQQKHYYHTLGGFDYYDITNKKSQKRFTKNLLMKILFLFSVILSSLSFAQTAVEHNFFDDVSEKSMAFVAQTDFEKFCKPTLKLINAYRKENGLKPVVFDQQMNQFSQAYAAELMEKDILMHSDLNGGEYAIENLFKSMGFGAFLVIDQKWCDELPNLIFDAWKKSKGHNANMLCPGITKVGMSIQIQTKGEVGSYGYNLDCILVGR